MTEKLQALLDATKAKTASLAARRTRRSPRRSTAVPRRSIAGAEKNAEDAGDNAGRNAVDHKTLLDQENVAHAAERIFPTQIGRKDKTRGPGWTPYKAAVRCEIPWPRFRKAMENREVNFVDFGNQRRVTDQEISRIRGLHGLSPTPEQPDETPVKAEPLLMPSSKDNPPLKAAE